MSDSLQFPNLSLSQLAEQGRDWVFVSINPDLHNASGHFLYLDKRLREAVHQQNGEFISLAHQTFAAKSEIHEEWIVPVFSQRSVSTIDDTSIVTRTDFIRELQESLAGLQKKLPGVKLLAVLYTGHVHLLPLVVDVLGDLPAENLYFTFNLYSASYDFEEGSPSYRRDYFLNEIALRFCAGLQNSGRLDVVADDLHTSQLIQKFMGRDGAILPFFSLKSPGMIPEKIPSKPDGEKITVSYLSYANEVRGFSLLADAARYCLEKHPEINWDFQIRTGSKDAHRIRFAKVLDELCSLGVTITEGLLSEEEMDAKYWATDILLIPYLAKYFAYRTSANTSDGIAYGLPIVAAEGTWSGRLISEIGNGEVFEDGNGASMGEAIVKVAKNLAFYKINCQTRGAAWLGRNSPFTMVQFIKERAWQTRVRSNPETLAWEKLVLQSFHTYYSGLIFPFMIGIENEEIRARTTDSRIATATLLHSSPENVGTFYNLLKTFQKLQESNFRFTSDRNKLRAKISELREKNEKLKMKVDGAGPKALTAKPLALERLSSLKSIFKKKSG